MLSPGSPFGVARSFQGRPRQFVGLLTSARSRGTGASTRSCPASFVTSDPDPRQTGIQRLVVDLHTAVWLFIGLGASRLGRPKNAAGPGFEARRELPDRRRRPGLGTGPVLELEVDELADSPLRWVRWTGSHATRRTCSPTQATYGTLALCGPSDLGLDFARSGNGACRKRAQGQHRRSCRGNESRDHFPFVLWSHFVRPPP